MAGAPRTRNMLDRLPDRLHVAAIDLDELDRQQRLVDHPQVAVRAADPVESFEVFHSDGCVGPGFAGRGQKRRPSFRNAVCKAASLARTFSTSRPLVGRVFLLQGRVGQGQHLHGQQAGVAGPAAAHAHGGHRHVAGHLHHREQRIEPALQIGGHGNADHRQHGMRGDDAGQVGRPARRGDDHPQARGRRPSRHIVARGPACDGRSSRGLHREPRIPPGPPATALIFGQSLSLPIRMPTRGVDWCQTWEVRNANLRVLHRFKAELRNSKPFGLRNSILFRHRIRRISALAYAIAQTSDCTASRRSRQPPGWSLRLHKVDRAGDRRPRLSAAAGRPRLAIFSAQGSVTLHRA